jgi:hypothetical protein
MRYEVTHTAISVVEAAIAEDAGAREPRCLTVAAGVEAEVEAVEVVASSGVRSFLRGGTVAPMRLTEVSATTAQPGP